MRAIKLITVSTVAVLMGGASLAIGQEGAGSLQGGSSILEDTTPNPGGARGPETEGSNPRAAENPVRHSETSGERGSTVRRSRGLQRSQAMQRGQAMAAERGRAITGERGLATTAEHRRAVSETRPRDRVAHQHKPAVRLRAGDDRPQRAVNVLACPSRVAGHPIHR